MKYRDWPCHRKTRDQWCDHDAEGGFMGHTCVPNCLPPVKVHLFHRLIEECSEVQKVSCKTLRFGPEFTNPNTGLPNIRELKIECADLVEVIFDLFDLEDGEFLAMREMKREKIKEWSIKEQSP